jgi:diguanylate cyclase (GGDEF)-like protein
MTVAEKRLYPGGRGLSWLRSDDLSRKIALAGYWACLAITIALVPFAGPMRSDEVLTALMVQSLLGAILALEPRLPGRTHGWGPLVAIVIYLASVALLRDGAGPTGGFGPLVLLPVGWAALRGSRRGLAVAVIGLAIVYLAPAWLVGAPHYPASTWRAGILFVAISSALGLAIIGLVRRIHRLLAQFDLLARTDELTGLPNRRALHEALEHHIRLAGRGEHAFSLALIDLDHFKRYNDTRGHLAADLLMREATAAWQSELRETDTLARWGGDEFVVLFSGAEPPAVSSVIERFRQAYPRAPFSAGIASGEAHAGAEAVIAAADQALYRAKRDRIGERAIASA